MDYYTCNYRRPRKFLVLGEDRRKNVSRKGVTLAKKNLSVVTTWRLCAFARGTLIVFNRGSTARAQFSPLTKFVLLYAAMYGGFGVASPFWPSFLSERGLPPEHLGLVLGAGTAVRLLTSPLAGRIGDLLGALRRVLVVFVVLSAIVTLSYLGAHGFGPLFAVNLLHAAALAPITVLSDALALGAASSRTHLKGFEYGWVRGTGSAVFIAGTLLSGQVVGAFGLSAIAVLQAALLAAAAIAAFHVPELVRDRTVRTAQAPAGGVGILFREPRFRTLVLFAALVLGSHALHDGFAVLRWSAAGISPAVASILWSESVAAEVVVFFVIGPKIITRLTPAGALATAALAGIVRWSVAAQTTHIAALALVQPLHGITFALLHLACMRLIARIVPDGFEGTAQAIYATVGIGLTSALLTIASGLLYARLGGQAFWIMAGLCAAALPFARKLKESRTR